MAEKTTTRDETVEKGSPSLNDHTNIKNPTKGQKAKAHCGKWWWIYLITFVILVLVIVLPVIFVAYPKLARSGVAKSRLIPTSESFLNPSPEAFDLDLTTVLISHSKFHPTLHPFNGSLHLEDGETPFAYIDVPEIPSAKNGTVVNVAQRVTIADSVQFRNFCDTALSSEQYTLRLKGKGSVKQGSLQSVSVEYDQAVESKGLNGFLGLEITTFFLQLNSSLPNNANSNGTVLVPNPSVLTLAVGDATFDISVNGTRIANATVPDLTLLPGNNTFTMNISSNITVVTGMLQEERYACGVLPVDIRGVESVYRGVVVPYFSDALSENSVRSMLDLGPALRKEGLGSLIEGKSCVT